MLSEARKEKQKEASPAYIDVDADPKHQDHMLLHTNKDIQALENNQILKDTAIKSTCDIRKQSRVRC